jgi:hypothetical protein
MHVIGGGHQGLTVSVDTAGRPPLAVSPGSLLQRQIEAPSGLGNM